MKKNDLIELTITSITNEGKGIARYNSFVIFIPNTAIGDKIVARILKVKKNYAYAKIETILDASKDRICSDCEISAQCGGCCFRHINYKAELMIKEQIVYDALTRIAKLDKADVENKLLPIIGAKNVDFYRNKVQVPVQLNTDNKVITGFFSVHTHRIIECVSCRLQPIIFNQIIDVIKDWIIKYHVSVYDEKSKKGVIRHIYLRIAEETNQVMVCLVSNKLKINYLDILVQDLVSRFSNIKSIWLNLNNKDTNVILGEKYKLIWGQKYITDILCGFRFNISPQAFYQVNHSQTELLYKNVLQLAMPQKTDNILDLFCGIGTIGLYIAKYCNKLLGIEVVESAVQNAKSNASINNIENAEFVCTDANSVLNILTEKFFEPDIIIIDPPRKGCVENLIDEISQINPKRVVYVSCNPSTLARDLKEFLTKGFSVDKIIPVDMFPKTMHVETVVLMSRIKD